MKKHTLEFDGIELSFSTHSVLSSIYMKCETGKIIGLMGRNGCGKSSLMKTVFGSLRNHNQSIRINSFPLIGSYQQDKFISYLPQENFIPHKLSVATALEYFEMDCESLTDYFPDFKVLLFTPARDLSGGHLRLLESFLILKSPHPFCLLDEPFSGLMPLHIECMKELISQAKSTKGIILSDHLYRHTMEMADEIYLLSNGKTYLIKDQEELVFRGYLQEPLGV
ncbi:MAG: ATP-binding cassette domain-containing protein [Bacteroidota bacterium]